MKRSYIVVAVCTAAVLVTGGALAANQRRDNVTPARPAAKNTTTPRTSDDVEQQFAQYHGEDYDRQFLANMIEHHDGAIDMAKLALAPSTRS